MASAPAVLREECWPDSVQLGHPVLNDVTRLNATTVHAVMQPLCIEDIQAALCRARSDTRISAVSVRGTKHSMGGHTLNENGLVIDMAFINHMSLSPCGSMVTVGTGATWAALIAYLNPHAKSPRTLQSYCNFSVGGSLSVNAHGITSDFCMVSTLLAFQQAAITMPPDVALRCRPSLSLVFDS
jgi:FAD/FMN-containing dehydrogenase